MPFCPLCGNTTAAEDAFCAACGEPQAGGKKRASSERLVDTHHEARPDADAALAFESVPGWLGWVAVPVVMFTWVLGLSIYAQWAWQRGRTDGRTLAPVVQPYSGFRLSVVGWCILAFFPIINLAAGVQLVTLCYKQGLRAGAARQKPVADPFIVFFLVCWLPVVGLFLALFIGAAVA